MSITYTLDQDRKIIFTTAAGNITLQDVHEYFKILQEDPAVPERLDVFLDARELQTVPTTQQLVTITEDIRQTRSKIKWGYCAIAATEPAIYGMGRILGVIAQALFSDIQVFYSYEEANIWLYSKVNSMV